MKNQKQPIVPLVKECVGLNVSGTFYSMKRANSAWIMIKIVVENNLVVSETVSDHDLMALIESKIVREMHKEAE